MADAIYLIVTSPNAPISRGGQPKTNMSAYYHELAQGETEADVVDRVASAEMLGCELIAVDASAGTRYRINPRAEAVE